MTLAREITVTHDQMRAGETELHAVLNVMKRDGLSVPSVALWHVSMLCPESLRVRLREVLQIVRQDNGYDGVRVLAYPDGLRFRFELDLDTTREGAD